MFLLVYETRREGFMPDWKYYGITSVILSIGVIHHISINFYEYIRKTNYLYYLGKLI